ncbi:MAG: hypothetical protein ACTSQZ_09155 [Candidatus Thorarchaeota archaeon]
MKKKIGFLAVAILLCLVFPILSSVPTMILNKSMPGSLVSAEVWFDDFSDGNITDWEIWGYNASDAQPCPGCFSVADGSLRADSVNTSVASHICPMTTGTWSFDVDCVSTDSNHFYVAFFSDEPTNVTLTPPYEYGIMVVTGTFSSFDTEFVFYRRNSGSIYLANLIGRYDLNEVTGWHHIDITRDSQGRFYAYFNSTLRIGGVDTTYTIAEYFSFYTLGGPAIDNVNVSNSIDIDQVEPFLDNPGNQEINEGESFTLDLDATDYSGISQWWLNDTEHFSIDSNGVIGNATNLAPGSYGLQVSVNDTLDYTTNVDFTVSVNEITSTTTTTSTTNGNGIDTMTLALIAGGVIAVVVIVLLVMKIKKS